MPNMRGREDRESGTSHPTTLPHCKALQDDATRGYAIAILASAHILSLPPKRTKLQAGRERALTSDELDTEWKEVWKTSKKKKIVAMPCSLFGVVSVT